MTLARRIAGVLLALFALDVLLLLLSGSWSLLDPSAAKASSSGIAWRLLALAVLLILRFRLLAEPASRMRANRLVLLLLLLPSLLQFQLESNKLSGVDGISYYVFLRSMVKDRDFELSNEYAHYGMLERPDLSMTTVTGHRRSIYSVGPAVVWTPFFLLGDAVARAAGLAGDTRAELSGYGRYHVNAVALGSLLYGFLALLLIESMLRRHFAARTALAATLFVWATTCFHFYMVLQPTYSHSASTLAAAYALWLFDRDRHRLGAWSSFYLGLLLGLAMCIRWQNGVLLALPGMALLLSLRRRRLPPLAFAAAASLLGAGVLVGIAPQMLAWKALYDMWLLPYPPHGADFLRLDHPFLLETLFSSRHGLLSWTPAVWAGFLGFVPLLLRRREMAAWLLGPLLAMTYVNCCAGDYWAGASFSNRRFDSLLPVFAFGFAAAWDALRGLVQARPAVTLLAFGAPFIAWNLTLAAQTAQNLIPRDDTVAFAQLARNAAGVVSERVGFPTTWPASWWFAARHALSPGRFDESVGRYLFYRQNSVGDTIRTADPAHASLLAEGWGAPAAYGELRGRAVRGRARLLAPLDVPEALELRIEAWTPEAPRDATVSVNGKEVGRFTAADAWASHRLLTRAEIWRRELNEVVIETPGSADVVVSAVRFVRRR